MSRIFTACVMGLVLFVTAAEADIPLAEESGRSLVSLDAEQRTRFELDGRDFSAETGLEDYGSLRTMLGLTFHPSSHVTLRLQFKESRWLGVEGNNTSPGATVTLQESYLNLNGLLTDDLSLKVGRFETVAGRGRLLGQGDWNLYGRRSYDGLQTEWASGRTSVRLAALRLTESSQAGLINSLYGSSHPATRADRNLFLLLGSLLDGIIQPIAMLDVDNSVSPTDRIATAGFYTRLDGGALRLDLDAALQSGRKAGRDLNSWLVTAELRHEFAAALLPTLSIGADLSSGNAYDSDSVSDPDHTFYAPYMRRHAFRGSMDLFRDVRRGMVDSFFRVTLHPQPVTVTVDLHNFATLQPDLSAAGNEFNQLGQELDLRCQLPVHDYAKLDALWCLFLPSGQWKPGGDPAQSAAISLSIKL